MSDKPILKSLRVKTMLEATMGAINTERKGGETSIEQVPETGQIMLHIHKHPEGDVKSRDRNAAPEFKDMDALKEHLEKAGGDTSQLPADPAPAPKEKPRVNVNIQDHRPGGLGGRKPKYNKLGTGNKPGDIEGAKVPALMKMRFPKVDKSAEQKIGMPGPPMGDPGMPEPTTGSKPPIESPADYQRQAQGMSAADHQQQLQHHGEQGGEQHPLNPHLESIGVFDASPQQLSQFAQMLGIDVWGAVQTPEQLRAAIDIHGKQDDLFNILRKHGLMSADKSLSETAGGMIGDFAKGFTQGSGLGMARNVAGRTARNAIRGATGMRFSAAAALYAADFDEAKHPRDEAGKFSEAHKNTGKKPPVEKLKDAMIDAGVMRENDRGRKSFVDAAIKALPANKWLTGYQVAKKAWNVNTAEARQGIIKAVKDLCKAGQVEKRWDDDGQVLYAWKGTDPTPGLLTEQEASEKWPNDPQEKKQSYGEKEVERLQSPAAGEPPLQPGDTLRTWRKMRYQNPGYVQSDKEVSRTIETIERGKRLKDPDKWKVKFKGNETWFILNAKTGVIRAMNAARTQYDTDAAEKNDSQDESPAGEKKKQGGIVMPTGEIDNEDAKGGDQLGLFEGTGKKKKLATKYKQDNPQGKARAKTLFDKDEDPDQQTLFGSFGEAVEYYAADLKKK